MAVENKVAVGATAADPILAHGMGGDVKGFSRTVEVSAAASATSTYTLGYVPANARILGVSKASWDDLASTGSPTLDLGLFPVDNNVTGDDDALNDGLVVTAAGSASLVKDIANYGKKAWQFVNGQATEPKGFLRLVATIKDADTDTGGTLAVEVFYVLP